MRTINIKGEEFENLVLALQHVNATGFGQVVSIGGKAIVVPDKKETEALASKGISFAYVFDHYIERTGQFKLVTVPVN